ncbi:MAG: ABC transporter ATP-binding protein [Rhodothermales bacterium]|nr:ABC transporter ATP-binding protein [Rhodothermales bacterium]MDG2017658.1 ABC transporter ATP-binding protein [Rhodothermales bacterium]
MESVLKINDLSRTYQSGSASLTVLKDVSFELMKGNSVSIVGPSGSGKTTLLGLSAGLDTPSTGSVELCGHPLSSLSEDDRARVRNEHVGFVFQSFRLIPTLTALENVMVPSELRGEKNAKEEAVRLLNEVGLRERHGHYPTQLSGGEQQRVALARAFINKPNILFADEPTGNLDSDTGDTIVDILFRLNETAGTTLVLVTHDMDLASRTERIIRLKGGEMVETASPSLASTHE